MNAKAQKLDEQTWIDPFRKRHSVRWLTGTVLLLAIYVLSIGPVLRLGAIGKVSQGTVDAIYMPLAVISKVAPPIRTFFGWYVDLWFNDPTPEAK